MKYKRTVAEMARFFSFGIWPLTYHWATDLANICDFAARTDNKKADSCLLPSAHVLRSVLFGGGQIYLVDELLNEDGRGDFALSYLLVPPA